MAGIPLSSGFNVSAGIPLDLRTTVADITERDNIPTIGRYPGLLVFVESESKYYYLKTGITNSDWAELSGFVSHTHVKADITDFTHTHLKSDITDFAHTHTKADITDFAHTHPISEITNLQSSLDAKVNTSDVVITATANKILKLDANAKLPASITGNADGNAATASKLQTARTITLSGDVSGSASFDGSANAAISTALSNTGVAAGTYTKLTVDSKGRATAGTNLSASDLPTHTHTKSQITDFAHTHIKSDITDFSHTHLKSDITDFNHSHGNLTFDGKIGTEDEKVVITNTGGVLDVEDKNMFFESYMSSVFPIGLKGEVYYINENNERILVPDFILKQGTIVENDEELTQAQGIQVSFGDIFNNWYLFSHGSYNSTYYNQYYINKAYSRVATNVIGSGTTATVTLLRHGFETGDTVTISGASPSMYNGTYTITVIDRDTFSYNTSQSITSSPATGTINITHTYTEYKDVPLQSPRHFPATDPLNPFGAAFSVEEILNNNIWSYDSVNDRITCLANYNTVTGYVSDKLYDKYELEVTISSTSSDDDGNGVVIAFWIDPDTGFEYTLTAVRYYGGASTQDYNYAIIYNLKQNVPSLDTYMPEYAENAEEILVVGSHLVNTSGSNWNVAGKTKMYVKRDGDLITVKVGQQGSDVIDQSTTLTYNLLDNPKTHKFRGPSRFGFFSVSQANSYFEDLNFTGFGNYIFYNKGDYHDTYEYDKTGDTWILQSPQTLTAHDYFGIGRLVYSPLFDKLYYTDYEGKIVKVSSGGSTDATTLNGYSSSDFALVNHTHTKSQITDFAHTHPYTEVNHSITPPADGTIADSTLFSNGISIGAVWGNNTTYPVGYGTLVTFKGNDQRTFQLYVSEKLSWDPNIYIRTLYNQDAQQWIKIWNELNDGSGSGLDADKLDGYHSSSFALASHTHSNYTPFASNTQTIPPNTGKWIRIATTSVNNVGRNEGLFEVEYAVSGYHGRVSFRASSHYNNYNSVKIVKVSGSHFNNGSIGIHKARLVFKDGVYSNEYAYVELYVKNYNTTSTMYVYTRLVDAIGWSLTTGDGSIPTGYTAKNLSLMLGYPIYSTDDTRYVQSASGGVLSANVNYDRNNVVANITSNTTINIYNIPDGYMGSMLLYLNGTYTLSIGSVTDEGGAAYSKYLIGNLNNLSAGYYLLTYRAIPDASGGLKCFISISDKFTSI